jgi:hypothetical protein
MTDSRTSGTLRRLIITSIVYIVVALIAGSIAVSRNLPAQPMGEGSGSGRPVLQEFLYGNGTAISPGIPWLALQAVLTFIASRKFRWSIVGVIGLALSGLLTGIFSMTEPMFRKIFSFAPFDPLLVLVEAGIVVLPFLMLIFAVLEWLGRRRRPA